MVKNINDKKIYIVTHKGVKGISKYLVPLTPFF